MSISGLLLRTFHVILDNVQFNLLNRGVHTASCVRALLKLCQSLVLCMGCCAGFFI